MSSNIWNYFKKSPFKTMAICHLCKKEYSFKTSITNLKRHLSYKHKIAYENFLKSNLMQSGKSGKIENEHGHLRRASASDFHPPADESNEPLKYSSEIWSYFEQETGGRVRCVVCCETRDNSLEDLKNHLQENHPKLLAQISQDSDYIASGTASESNDDDNENMFTEVVYLEEEGKKEISKTPIKKSPKPSKIIHTYPQKKIKKPSEWKERKDSSSSDEVPKKRKKIQNDDELDTFVTYITCLLKKLPKDVSSKLQMDIINLIMNAKLNKSYNESNIVLDSVPLTLQNVTIPNSSYIMSVSNNTIHDNTRPSTERKDLVSDSIMSASRDISVPHTSTVTEVSNPVLPINSYSITVPGNHNDPTNDK